MRKFLIHLLGGYTAIEHEEAIITELRSLKQEAERLSYRYGKWQIRYDMLRSTIHAMFNHHYYYELKKLKKDEED